MFTVKIAHASTNLKDFLAKYQDVPRFLSYCKDCPKYTTRWSCPPLSFAPKAFLADYTTIYIVGVQIFYDHERIAKIVPKSELQLFSRKLLRYVKKQIALHLIDAEAKLPHTLSFSSGGCDWCCKCTRIAGQPCKNPDKMRYSLDSFGLDLGGITEEFLNIKLLWAKENTLPEYHTLIHALAAKKDVPKQAVLDNLATLKIENNFQF